MRSLPAPTITNMALEEESLVKILKNYNTSPADFEQELFLKIATAFLHRLLPSEGTRIQESVEKWAKKVSMPILN